MNRQSPRARPVKRFSERKPRENCAVLLDRRTWVLFIRLNGYVRGCFTRGARFKLWSNEAFARASGVSLSNVRKAFPRFRDWASGEWKFEKIRRGRRWVFKITPEGVPGADVLTAREVKARLLGAVVRASWRDVLNVDAEFIRKFAALANLPIREVERAWLTLKKIPGRKCRWRGIGRGRKFVVSLKVSEHQTSEGISSPTGRRESKTAGAGARESEPIQRAPGAAGGGGWGTGAVWDDNGRNPSGVLSNSPEAGPGSHIKRQFPAAPPPMQVCRRWVSGWKVRRFATWLAFAKLRPMHGEFDRVEFLAPHALNFAERAGRFGYAAEEICRAYRAGLATSHNNSLERDRLPGGGYAFRRKPSEAVALAWRALRSDGGTTAERWGRFFEAPRRARELIPAGPRPAPAPVEAPRLTPRQAAETLAELRRKIAPQAAAGIDADAEQPDTLTAGEFAEFLRGRGMSLADFGRIGYTFRESLLRAARAEKARRGGDGF